MSFAPDRRRRGVMSREITVTDVKGLSKVYELAIATFEETQNGNMANLQISKFEKEVAGIEYFDCRIEFKEVENNRWKMIVG